MLFVVQCFGHLSESALIKLQERNWKHYIWMTKREEDEKKNCMIRTLVQFDEWNFRYFLGKNPSTFGSNSYFNHTYNNTYTHRLCWRSTDKLSMDMVLVLDAIRF